MKSLYLLLGLLLTLTIVAGRWLAVGESERADQLVRDGRLEAALPLLEEKFRESDEHTPHLVLNLAYARMASGFAASGIELLKTTAREDSSKIEIQAAMRNSFDFSRYQEALAQSADIRSIRERAAVAALRGDYEQERLALLDLAKGNEVKARELIQLAALQSARGDFHTAALTMRRAGQLLPITERGGLFVLELKLLTKDGVTSNEDLLKRAKEFLATERGKSTSHQILWNFIKLHRPGISLQLIEKPLADPETFNAFVAAKEATGGRDDIISAILKGEDLSKMSKEQCDLIVRIAPKNPAVLLRVLTAFEKRALPLTDEQMTQIAYASMELNPQATQAAEAVLMQIAERRGGKHASSKALRYLWGPRPKDSAVEWTVKQARNPSATERQEWFQYLIASGHMERVIDLAETPGNVPGINEALLKGILSGSNREMSRAAIAVIQKQAKSPELLLRAAHAAKNVELFEQAAELARHALRIKISHPKALAFLGILEAQRGEYQTAVPILRDLINLPKGLNAISNQEKVLALYLYAVSLEHTGHAEKARETYARALETLRAVYSKDFDLTLQAELLTKVEGADQGIKLLRAQQRTTPLKTEERLLLGRLLTDREKLTEAHQVLFEEVGK